MEMPWPENVAHRPLRDSMPAALKLTKYVMLSITLTPTTTAASLSGPGHILVTKGESRWEKPHKGMASMVLLKTQRKPPGKLEKKVLAGRPKGGPAGWRLDPPPAEAGSRRLPEK